MEDLLVEDSFAVGPGGGELFVFFMRSILWGLGILAIPIIIYIVFIFIIDRISRNRLKNNMKIYEEITAEKAHKEQEMIDEKRH